MLRAQCGSEGAYARLLQELPPVIGRMIRRQLASAAPSDQEDLLQEVLISVHTARATYDPARPFIPWLKAIVVNRAIDFLRRQQRNARGQALTDEMAADIADDSAGDAVIRYDAVDALQKAIRKLPAGQRSAIELLKLREMSLREAAATTGMSIECAQGVGASRGPGLARIPRALSGRMNATGTGATDAILMTPFSPSCRAAGTEGAHRSFRFAE